MIGFQSKAWKQAPEHDFIRLNHLRLMPISKALGSSGWALPRTSLPKFA